MTIKDMERLLGIAKANIRYYEQEGLIAPERLPNGYRDYGEKELEALEKIKLLRELGVAIEDIRAMQQGEEELSSVMSRRLYELEKERKAVEHAKDVCRSMREAGERYDTLDVAKYRRALPPEQPPVRVIAEARQPYEKPHPWRRLFARNLDLLLYDLGLNLLLIFLLGYEAGTSGGAEIILFFVSPLLMLLIEPLMLSLFGATFGKLLFGIRVYDRNGNKLSYSHARSRVKEVYLHGMGLRIPIYSQVRMIRSWLECRSAERLSWEYDTETVAVSMKWWRSLIMGVGYIVLVLAITLVPMFVWMPPNRGDLTVAEFAENYNYMIDIYGYDTMERLDENGRRIPVNNMTPAYQKPEFEFEYIIENGVITAISYSAELNGVSKVGTTGTEQTFAAFAFISGRKDFSIFADSKKIEKSVRDYSYMDTKISVASVYIERDVEYSGYEYILPSGGLHTDEDGADTARYSESFSMVIE